MRKIFRSIIPLFIGLAVSLILNVTVGWWGFWVIFPWIGLSISTGIFIQISLQGERKKLGRKITLLMIMPLLLIWVPVVNNENFQIEGVLLIVVVGFFSKGFIHYAIAKIFGPLIWGRGFCGWACWTAAVLEWLPMKGNKKTITPKMKRFRFLMLFFSILLPAYLVFVLSYDVYGDYINHREMIWMFAGNALYYILGIALAYIFNDRRAFCKILCPVSLVMKAGTSVAAIRMRPSGNECVKCGRCSTACPMDIDVMSYISNGKKITSTECILCGECRMVCPVNAIR